MTYFNHKSVDTVRGITTGPFHLIDHNSLGNVGPCHDAAITLAYRLYRDTLGQIANGNYPAGQRLPSIRAMSHRCGVSPDTVLRAYDHLVADGRARAVRGSGYFVTEPESSNQSATPVERRDPLDAMHLIHSDHPLDHQPGSGILRHEAGAQLEVARILRSVVASRLGSDGGYSDPRGYLPLRQHLQSWLRQAGVDSSVDAIVTVPGATAGISLVLRALLRAGSAALIEDPSSFIHLHALMAQGAEIFRVPRLADGPDIDVLRGLCERHRPKMFLLSSLLQNPTGTSIALHKAQKLIEIAAEFEMVLIDDCSYADLLPRPGDQPLAPLILLDQLRRVIHVGSYSRTVSSAVGPAYVVAGEAHMRYIRAYRPLAGLGNMIVAERTLYRLLSEGLYRRRCERTQAHLARQMLALRQRAASIGLALPPNRAGMFLWLTLGKDVDSAAVAARMLARGFLTAPARHFTPSPNGQSHMRFNVTTTTEAAMVALSASS